MSRTGREPPKENLRAILRGIEILHAHHLFGHLAHGTWKPARPSLPFPKDGYARITVGPRSGWTAGNSHRRAADWTIEANVWRRVEPAEWAHVFAQAFLHVYFNHLDVTRADAVWQIACQTIAVDFLRNVGCGSRPADLPYPDLPPPGRTVEDVVEVFENDPQSMRPYGGTGLAGSDQPTWIVASGTPAFAPEVVRERTKTLGAAIRRSVMRAIEDAGSAARPVAKANPGSLAEEARSWFITHYPLLASLAAAFEIVEDAEICAQYDIAIAAVDSEIRRVYINPKFPWTKGGMRFVMAHELLHVGLRHEERRQGRDAYLWNIACDYVINGWLVEMGVGEIPIDTLMLDPELGLEKESAEAVYDRIVGDLRLIRRLNKGRTLRGQGKVDILGDRPPKWWTGPGFDLDSFYRRALAEGLELHLSRGRGLLPGNLVEEIKALQHPPIPWDVRLGQWLDDFFPPLERRRSFARSSRRQSSSPDIPRAVWERPPERVATRTFGVVLDTSGSMPPWALARALGAIASYAMSREVFLVRIIQCDAGFHDMGYVDPESLLQTVEVQGRGGTILQPAISFLEEDERFPKDAPILVITDGACDVLAIRRRHAFLMPEGCRLPFRTAAPVFAFEPVSRKQP
jgi:predicted metal-dependent peptidase